MRSVGIYRRFLASICETAEIRHFPAENPLKTKKPKRTGVGVFVVKNAMGFQL